VLLSTGFAFLLVATCAAVFIIRYCRKRQRVLARYKRKQRFIRVSELKDKIKSYSAQLDYLASAAKNQIREAQEYDSRQARWEIERQKQEELQRRLEHIRGKDPNQELALGLRLLGGCYGELAGVIAFNPGYRQRIDETLGRLGEERRRCLQEKETTEKALAWLEKQH
jgi:hypothetical protein